ncbi:MAG TPA: DsbA family protein [Xanthobacteraceae bacterium]|nr:DsbA family protein [Xanthobacteraceae bacterium]
MPRPPIDFWFSIGSIYTYLAVMRIDEIARRENVAFRWRPFSIRVIMKEMDNFPASKPAKLAYSWRDAGRRAAAYGFPLRPTPPYPIKEYELANRVAVVGAFEDWCPAYVRATYRRWFHDHAEPGAEPNLGDSLREIGQDPDRVRARAEADDVRAAWRAATDEARALGIFGVPSFVSAGELFWGDDRLEDAARWQAGGR